MKIFDSIKTGCTRASRSWKGIFVIWIVSLFLVSIVALPLKSTFNSAIGKSMITEKLSNGIDVAVFADLESTFGNMVISWTTGLLILILVNFFLNAFFSAGLFSSLRSDTPSLRLSDFFRSSAKYFWSFCLISLLTDLVIMFLFILIILVPVAISMHPGASWGSTVFIIAIVASSVFLLLTLVLLLIADFARAWQVSRERKESVGAIKQGLGYAFRTFSSSYALMILFMLIQVACIAIAIMTIGSAEPSGAKGIILLFILSQVLFVVRIYIRTSRYGAITRLFEVEAGKNEIKQAEFSLQ